MEMAFWLWRAGSSGHPGSAWFSGCFPATQQNTAVKYLPSKLIWLAVVLIAGSGAWLVLSGSTSTTTATMEREPVRLATASTSEPAQSPATDSAQDGSSLNPQVTPEEAIAPVETSPVDGLK